ncbi:DUF1559 domain-containing protein [Anatilimnocola sp. NA78]|uniref:DUF1559 family PulG-like putative transporter n=1 Tax=Anatilimnocola sp. NA78 TaxID=3415683 RepID=UPI003CE4B69E
MLSKLSSTIVLGLLLLAGSWCAAQDKAGKLEPIVPFVDAQTLAIVRIDPAKIDIAATAKLAVAFAPEPVPPQELEAAIDRFKGFLATLAEYGGQEIFVVLSLADIPEPPILLTLRPGANEALITSHLQKSGLIGMAKLERLHNVLVYANESTMDRLRTLKAVARPDLATAMANNGDTAVQIALAIPTDAQRVVREMLGKLPAELGGGEGQDLLDSLQWASVAIDAPPRTSLKLTIQSKNQSSAENLRPRILAGFNLLGEISEMKKTMPKFAELAIRLTPTVKSDKLELAIEGNEVDLLLQQLKAGPFSLVSEASMRTRSVNNLKLIALAMHNFHDTHSRFPAAGSSSKDGKPLLSWRVQILPYVEQLELYNKFHHDEPWDSEHNRKLISEIPRVFVAPAHPALAKEGKTVYVVPVGEKAVFGGTKGAQFREIVDGTSNTIMVVDLAPENAVIWTQPADWEFNPKDPAKGLLDESRKQFITAFCDGSVHTLPATIDRNDLRRLVQMSDGEVLSENFFRR